MTRGKYYSVAVPIADILSVAIGLIFHTGIVWAVGAVLLGIVPIAGNAITHP